MKQLQEGVDGVKGIEQEPVPLLNLLNHALLGVQILRLARLIGRKEKFFTDISRQLTNQGKDIAHVQRRAVHKHLVRFQVQSVP